MYWGKGGGKKKVKQAVEHIDRHCRNACQN